MLAVDVSTFTAQHAPAARRSRIAEFDAQVQELRARDYTIAQVCKFLALNGLHITTAALSHYLRQRRAKATGTPESGNALPLVTPRPQASALLPSRHRVAPTEAALDTSPSLDSATGGSAIPEHGPTRDEILTQTTQAPAPETPDSEAPPLIVDGELSRPVSHFERAHRDVSDLM